jgi:hypothetical protein
MNRNPVSAATELVDATPSKEFLTTLHAQLLADFTESRSTHSDGSQNPTETPPPESVEDYITLAPTPSPVGPNRRLSKTLITAAACVAVFATGAMIVTRADRAAIELGDVNQQEALPLAQRALLARDATPDGVGHGWSNDQDWAATQLPSDAEAMIEALPGCALLRSVGLLPPTTKSASAYQQSSDGTLQHVFVFATPEDASRAMDVIAGEVYPTCWFDVFDRRIAHSRATMTISEAWDAPPIASHGDRQVIIGQHETLLTNGFRLEYYLVNAYTQVGRAISLIDPVYVTDASNPLLAVETDIAAATTALTNVFGP